MNELTTTQRQAPTVVYVAPQLPAAYVSAGEPQNARSGASGPVLGALIRLVLLVLLGLAAMVLLAQSQAAIDFVMAKASALLPLALVGGLVVMALGVGAGILRDLLG